MKRVALFILFALFCWFLYFVWSQEQPGYSAPAISPQDTPRPGLYGLVLGALNAQATASASNRTANEYYAAATDQAYQLTNAAGDQYTHQTVEAGQVSVDATARAAATATVQQWVALAWTATSSADRATVEALQTAQAQQYTATAINLEYLQTLEAAKYNANTLRLTNARNEATNQILAWTPYAAFALAALAIVAFGTVSGIKYWRTPVAIQRDPRGDAPILAGNNGQVYDIDRSPSGAIQMTPSGLTSPQLADPTIQERTTARDQAVDLASRGLPSQQPLLSAQSNRQRQAATQAMLPAQPNYQIIYATTPPQEIIRDQALAQVLEAQWKEV